MQFKNTLQECQQLDEAIRSSIPRAYRTAYADLIQKAIDEVRRESGLDSVTLKLGKQSFRHVTSVEQFKLQTKVPVPAYADLVINFRNSRHVLVGFRRKSGKHVIPPVIEEGLSGVEKIFPSIRLNFASSFLQTMDQEGFEHGETIPKEIYGRLNDTDFKETLVLGNRDLGGKISWAIINPSKTPKIRTIAKRGIVKVSVSLADTQKLMEESDIYVKFSPNAKGNAVFYLLDDKTDKSDLPILASGPESKKYKPEGGKWTIEVDSRTTRLNPFKLEQETVGMTFLVRNQTDVQSYLMTQRDLERRKERQEFDRDLSPEEIANRADADRTPASFGRRAAFA